MSREMMRRVRVRKCNNRVAGRQARREESLVKIRRRLGSRAMTTAVFLSQLGKSERRLKSNGWRRRGKRMLRECRRLRRLRSLKMILRGKMIGEMV